MFMKKIISVLILLSLALSLGVVPSSAASTRSGKCGKDLTYNFNGATGELVISGTGPMYDYTFDDKQYILEMRLFEGEEYVVTFPEWYDIRNEIKTIVIEDGVTSVGIAAFQYTENLTEVKFPKNSIRLEYYSFYGTGLKNLVIPETVKTIGARAFGESALESVTLPKNFNSIGCSATYFDYTYTWFYSCKKLHTVVIPKGEKKLDIPGLFDGCSSLKKVTIPDGVESMVSDFFLGSGVEEIYIPASLKNLGEPDAFYGCWNIKKIVVDPGNTKFAVSGGALYSLDKSKLIRVFGGVEDFTLSSATTMIYDTAFQSASDLRKIAVKDGNHKFGVDKEGILFEYGYGDIVACPRKGVNSIKIDGGQGRKIRPYAFSECEIKEVTFSGNISFSIHSWYGIEKVRCESGTSFSKPEGYSYNFHSGSFPDLKQIDVVDEEIDEQIWNMKGRRTDVIINFCCDTPVELMGDVNKDSVVDMKDCVTLIRATLGWNEPIYGNASDMNGDGKYGMADVIMLIRKLVNS